jgi:hypothetical protein
MLPCHQILLPGQAMEKHQPYQQIDIAIDTFFAHAQASQKTSNRLQEKWLCKMLNGFEARTVSFAVSKLSFQFDDGRYLYSYSIFADRFTCRKKHTQQ